MKKLNNKGFTLFELLISLLLLGVILGVGLYLARGTLATSIDTINSVSEKEIYDIAEVYVLENNVSWNNNGDDYICLSVLDLVDKGYFNNDEVSLYKDKEIKIVRNSISKVIDSINIVDVCE